MAWGENNDVGTGLDFDTLNLFEGDHDGDTVTSGDTTATCVGTVQTTSIYWSGWQSGQSATKRIVITAVAANQPDGVNDATGNKALLAGRTWINQATNALYMNIVGIETTFPIVINTSPGGEFHIAKCVSRDGSGGGNNPINALTGITASCLINIGGCLIKDWTNNYTEGIDGADSDATINIVNTTIAGLTGVDSRGINRSNSTMTAKNCALVNNTIDISGTVTETTNKSEDDAEITNTDADDFKEPSTGDYTVYDSSSALYEAGTTESASWFTTLCPTDLNGVTWRATPSVGCYELAAAESTFVPKIWISKSNEILKWFVPAFVLASMTVLEKNPEMTRRGLFNISNWFKEKEEEND